MVLYEWILREGKKNDFTQRLGDTILTLIAGGVTGKTLSRPSSQLALGFCIIC